MKAVVCTRYGPPEVLQVAEVETPTPKDHEIRVKVRATTVTAADFRVRSFTIPLAFWIPARLILGVTKPKKPILGVELAGEVDAVGKNVKLFVKGDHVFASTLTNMGAYAEYTCIPENGAIALKPENISFEEAAAIPIGACTALRFLRKGEIEPGKKILIYGASGSVGTYAVQLAKHFGAEVTGICSTANVTLVKSLGADKVIDYTSSKFLQSLETYDLVFVAVDKIPFGVCNKLLNDNGVYLNVTAPVKNLNMIWTSIATRKKIIIAQNEPETVEDLVFIRKLVETGQLKVVIDRRYKLDEIVEAHRYVDLGHKKGNVVVTI